MTASWVEELQINSLFDAFDVTYRTWSIAKVIEIEKSRIKIHFCGWDTHFDRWWFKDKFSDPTKVAPLSTNTINTKFCQFKCDEYEAKCYRFITSDPETHSLFYTDRIADCMNLIKFNHIQNECKLLGTHDKICVVAFDGNSMYFIPYLYNKDTTSIKLLNTKSGKWSTIYLQSPSDEKHRIRGFLFSSVDHKFHLFIHKGREFMGHIVYDKKDEYLIKIKEQWFDIYDIAEYQISAKEHDYWNAHLLNGTKLVRIFTTDIVHYVVIYDLESGTTMLY